MANEKHLKVLENGVESWNSWRKRFPDIKPDLSGIKYGFTGSRLHRYSKPGVNTSTYGVFTRRNLSGINFSDTDLSASMIRETILDGAVMRGANLQDAEFRQINFIRTDFRESDLQETHFILADFRAAGFDHAVFGGTHFGYSPLKDCAGFSTARHLSASHMDFPTLCHSRNLPFNFVRHFGVDEDKYDLAQRVKPEVFVDCFISYSTRDENFVQPFRQALLENGVPCWYAPEDYRINFDPGQQKKDDHEVGRDLFNFIDSADVIILILSNNSLNSDWVNEEIIRSKNKIRILPVWIADLDFSKVQKQRSWYNQIIKDGAFDFRHWHDREAIRRSFQQLIGHLRKAK